MNDFWGELIRAIALGAVLMWAGMWFLGDRFEDLQVMLWLDAVAKDFNAAAGR